MAQFSSQDEKIFLFQLRKVESANKALEIALTNAVNIANKNKLKRANTRFYTNRRYWNPEQAYYGDLAQVQRAASIVFGPRPKGTIAADISGTYPKYNNPFDSRPVV